MRRVLQPLGILTCAMAAAVMPLAAQTVISNEGDPAMGHHTYFGFPEITFGQTFTAPNATDIFLQSFRISIGSPALLPYTVRLMEWTGSMAGAVLFSEAVASTPPSRTYVTFDVNTMLTFGTQYIFALSLTPGGANIENFMSFVDTYPGGNEAVIVSADLATIQSSPWTSRETIDAGFTATFLPGQRVVPEPMTMVLLGTGLLGLGVIRRRRRTA
jgi:hypothetical protein